MHRSALQERATGADCPTWPHRCLLKSCYLVSANVVIGNNLEKLAIIPADMTMLGPDEPDGICDHRVEHRLEIRGRACNDPQNLARGSLLFQRFGKVAVPGLQFLKQPDVFDGDHRLVGEGF